MLQKVNPRLIETHVTGFGWDGLRSSPSIDPLAQALKWACRAPGRPGIRRYFISVAPTTFTAGAMGALGNAARTKP